MNLYDYLELTTGDYDTTDSDYDGVVTVCYIGDENDNYDKFCNKLAKKVEVLNISDDYLVANWSAFIKGNLEKFRAFSKEYWKRQYKDEDEFIYQWIREFHNYLAGMVGESFYAKLVAFVDSLTSAITKNYVACINSCYLRDTQIFNTEHVLDLEKEEDVELEESASST